MILVLVCHLFSSCHPSRILPPGCKRINSGRGVISAGRSMLGRAGGWERTDAAGSWGRQSWAGHGNGTGILPLFKIVDLRFFVGTFYRQTYFQHEICRCFLDWNIQRKLEIQKCHNLLGENRFYLHLLAPVLSKSNSTKYAVRF